jgi:predicted ATPase
VAAFLYLMQKRHPENYRLIRRTVQRIFPRFDDFTLRPNPHSPNSIRLEWKERGEDYRFGPHQLSDGTLRFICLATLLLQRELPSTVIIDEPELGLHPRALGVLAGLVRSAASRTQLILTTQSVTFLDHFEAKDVIVVDREEEAKEDLNGEMRAHSTFRRLDNQEQLDEWLEEYTVGELWEMNMIGGRP